VPKSVIIGKKLSLHSNFPSPCWGNTWRLQKARENLKRLQLLMTIDHKTKQTLRTVTGNSWHLTILHERSQRFLALDCSRSILRSQRPSWEASRFYEQLSLPVPMSNTPSFPAHTCDYVSVPGWTSQISLGLTLLSPPEISSTLEPRSQPSNSRARFIASQPRYAQNKTLSSPENWDRYISFQVAIPDSQSGSILQRTAGIEVITSV